MKIMILEHKLSCIIAYMIYTLTYRCSFKSKSMESMIINWVLHLYVDPYDGSKVFMDFAREIGDSNGNSPL